MSRQRARLHPRRRADLDIATPHRGPRGQHEGAHRGRAEENEAVKRGETPAEWERKPAKNCQKDKDARWTKKHSRSFFGYKNHVNVDRTHKLIRRYAVTDAAVHDSRKLDGLLHQGNTSQDVFGDSA